MVGGTVAVVRSSAILSDISKGVRALPPKIRVVIIWLFRDRR